MAAPPVGGPPGLSARDCESHTCLESRLAAVGPEDKAHHPSCSSYSVYPCRQVSEVPSFSLCLLVCALNTVNGL